MPHVLLFYSGSFLPYPLLTKRRGGEGNITLSILLKNMLTHQAAILKPSLKGCESQKQCTGMREGLKGSDYRCSSQCQMHFSSPELTKLLSLSQGLPKLLLNNSNHSSLSSLNSAQVFRNSHQRKWGITFHRQWNVIQL